MDIKSIMGRQVEMLDSLEHLLKKELPSEAIDVMVKNFGAEWKTDTTIRNCWAVQNE